MNAHVCDHAMNNAAPRAPRTFGAVETCMYAIEQGVEGVVILDGQTPHAVLLELLTDHGVGTLMHR